MRRPRHVKISVVDYRPVYDGAVRTCRPNCAKFLWNVKAELMCTRSITAKRIANKMNVSMKQLAGILEGEEPLTADFALKMERA